MKARLQVLAGLIPVSPAIAQSSNIEPAHKFSWTENCGWLNWRDSGNPAGSQGARINGFFLSGFIWGENIG